MDIRGTGGVGGGLRIPGGGLRVTLTKNAFIGLESTSNVAGWGLNRVRMDQHTLLLMTGNVPPAAARIGFLFRRPSYQLN